MRFILGLIRPENEYFEEFSPIPATFITLDIHPIPNEIQNHTPYYITTVAVFRYGDE
jgi:hypothetical protein